MENVKLALIDEPVNNLDAKHIRQLSDLLTRIQCYNTDFAVVIITHCHAFPNITKAFEITSERTLKSTDYQVHNCLGAFDKDGFYQSEMRAD
jgi:DNA repair exonuclease SbcCD ATPase subunit